MRGSIRRPDDLKRDGLIRFACNHINTYFDADADVARLERLVVAGLADRLILSGGWAVELSDLYHDLTDHPRFDIKRTITALCKRNLLSEDHSATRATTRFMDPRLGEIAIGSRLAQAAVPYSLSVDRSALCTAAEIYIRMSDVAVAEENVTKKWRQAIAELRGIAERSDDECPTALAAVGGALNAASSLKYVVTLETSALDTVWKKADLATQKAFADRPHRQDGRPRARSTESPLGTGHRFIPLGTRAAHCQSGPMSTARHWRCSDLGSTAVHLARECGRG
ncbi:hypothetical protein BZL29_7974 [Mycobacterium kansasii]|uniref:Uncharacterized protein n=1 Tax=Mycobacterium kansasii TaxID=1768 RepID=A0A1V3WFI1_MYCKA|nr:hypothetical protein BZL29_7974 [Mycobacterium kansasii]